VTERKVARVKTGGHRKEVRKRIVRDTSTTIRGILVPVDWDEDGNILAIAVSTPGEQQYIVEKNSKGKELLGMIRQEVEVTGVVGTGTKDSKTITVNSYVLNSVYGRARRKSRRWNSQI
jgi:hypothetical protein